MNALPVFAIAPELHAVQSAAPLMCSGLVHGYGHTAVLRGVDLTVPAGSVLGLIGRNGAGKSTLIAALLGLYQPQGGQASVFGQPSLHMDDATKARIGYVPQQPEALAWLQVQDMLDFVGRFYPNWDADYVRSTLARWQLPTDRPLAKLSPGERQRVAIIRALASQPELLVLDEPAAALDPVARRDLLREIATRAADAGTTVLFSTHIVSDLERVASHVAFLHEGRILLNTELDGLKEHHARLQVPAAVAGQLAGKLSGEVARRTHADGSVAITLIRDDGSLPPLAQQPGVRVEHLSLEDLFIEVAE